MTRHIQARDAEKGMTLERLVYDANNKPHTRVTKVESVYPSTMFPDRRVITWSDGSSAVYESSHVFVRQEQEPYYVSALVECALSEAARTGRDINIGGALYRKVNHGQ
jgi:hypothetical protein